VQDPNRFAEELERPLDGHRHVTEAEIERDGAAFVAFAAAMGVRPPAADALPSSPSTS